MNFSIRKPCDDFRHNTCGVELIDGTVVVLEYSPDTHGKLERLREFGYIVEETTMKAGVYSEEDFGQNAKPMTDADKKKASDDQRKVAAEQFKKAG